MFLHTLGKGRLRQCCCLQAPGKGFSSHRCSGNRLPSARPYCQPRKKRFSNAGQKPLQSSASLPRGLPSKEIQLQSLRLPQALRRGPLQHLLPRHQGHLAEMRTAPFASGFPSGAGTTSMILSSSSLRPIPSFAETFIISASLQSNSCKLTHNYYEHQY